MKRPDRFCLHFGPYPAPRLRYGATIYDEVRGHVRVVGITDARIPWPLGRPPGVRGRASLIVCGALAKAVQRESNLAVTHWWGVTGQTVTKWRKFLDVRPITPGTSRLYSAYTFAEPAQRGRQKSWAKSRDAKRDAGRRAKIAAALTGKKRPAAVVAAMRKAMLGRRASKATRRKMSEIHRRRGTLPPGIKPWPPEHDRLLRTLPAKEVARRIGRTLQAVYTRRSLLGLPDGRRRAR